MRQNTFVLQCFEFFLKCMLNNSTFCFRALRTYYVYVRLPCKPEIIRAASFVRKSVMRVSRFTCRRVIIPKPNRFLWTIIDRPINYLLQLTTRKRLEQLLWSRSRDFIIRNRDRSGRERCLYKLSFYYDIYENDYLLNGEFKYIAFCLNFRLQLSVVRSLSSTIYIYNYFIFILR